MLLFFQMQTKTISYEDAICEIIDGILENHSRNNDENKKTTVKFNLLLGGTRLDIEENSGGIAREKFQSVATLGGSGWGKLRQVFHGSFRSRSEKQPQKDWNKPSFVYLGNKADARPCEIKFDEKLLEWCWRK